MIRGPRTNFSSQNPGLLSIDIDVAKAIISLKLLVWIYQTSNLNFPLKSIRLATANCPQSGYDSDMFLDSTIYNSSNFDVSRYLGVSVA